MGSCASTKARPYDLNRIVMPYKILVTAVIWPKSHHNLFDFEQTNHTTKTIEVDFSAIIANVDKELIAIQKHEWAKNQTELININMGPDSIQLSAPSSKDKKLWAVIKSDNSQYKSLDVKYHIYRQKKHWDLSVNDVIKLGRVRLQLTEMAFMKTDEEVTQILEEEQEDLASGNDVANCRFCFSSCATDSNPLLSPCLCGGSVKYIHLQCLQKWIAIQLKVKQGDNYIQYVWKRLECEICRQIFRNSYTFGEKTYQVLKVPRPRSSHLTFKVTNDDKSKECMIFVIEIGDKTELKIGRVIDCDIKLRDISVSRQHAFIKLIPTEFHTPEHPDYVARVIDNKSKFGTLVLAKNQEILTLSANNPNQDILFQTERVLLKFKPKRKTNTKPVYKHPENIPLFNIDIQELADQDTDRQDSFPTHNELQIDDIIISNKPTVKKQASVEELPLEEMQPQKIPMSHLYAKMSPKKSD